MNSGKYACMGLWVKYALGKSFRLRLHCYTLLAELGFQNPREKEREVITWVLTQCRHHHYLSSRPRLLLSALP